MIVYYVYSCPIVLLCNSVMNGLLVYICEVSAISCMVCFFICICNSMALHFLFKNVMVQKASNPYCEFCNIHL